MSDVTDELLADASMIDRLVSEGRLRAIDVVERSLDRALECAPLAPFVIITAERARRRALDVDEAVRRGERVGPLAGVPVTVKDNLHVEGFPTTHGSRVTPRAPAGYSSPAVSRVEQAGACVIGKTTLPEFATKGVGSSPLTGETRNPWDATRTTGGSSAGGAVTVAMGVAPIAIVTDGGGSTRLPASFCGVVGLKPQFGRIPYVPVSATPAMSHVGILARNIADARVALHVVHGADSRDPNSFLPGDIRPAPDDVGALRLAWCPGFAGAVPEADVREITARAAALIAAELGCELDEIPAPFTDVSDIWESDFLAGAGHRNGALVAAHHAEMDPAVVAQLRKGMMQTLPEYLDAADRRLSFRADVHRFFEEYDALLTPTLPVTAFALGQDHPDGYVPHDPADTLGWVKYLSAFNITGNPAVSVPVGFDRAGMPIGLQVVARADHDETVLTIAEVFQRVSPFPSPTTRG